MHCVITSLFTVWKLRSSFNAEEIFKLKTGKDSLHKISDDKERAENFYHIHKKSRIHFLTAALKMHFWHDTILNYIWTDKISHSRSIIRREFLTCWATIQLSRRTLLHGICHMKSRNDYLSLQLIRMLQMTVNCLFHRHNDLEVYTVKQKQFDHVTKHSSYHLHYR